MNKRFRIQVFGKEGCDKCKTLNRRLDKLLADETWQDFEKQYCDVETEDGIITFSEAECINPQRIPALLVTAWDEATQAYERVPNPSPGVADSTCGKSRLYQYLGLQTDYSDTGRGVITPVMINAILDEARSTAEA